MKRLLGLLLLLMPLSVSAQELTEEDYYYPYATYADLNPEPEPLVDSLFTTGRYDWIFHASQELYGEVTRYALPQMTRWRGGEGFATEAITLYGMALPYDRVALLRLLSVEEREAALLSPLSDAFGTTGGVQSFTFSDELPNRPDRITVRYAERGYRLGVRGAFDRFTDRGWRVAAAMDLRTGRDARVEGVFTDALHLGGRLSRTWESGHRFALFLSLPFTMRGLRSSSTEEAYTLLDDPYYNPSWGFQAGEVRNARVRREALPYLMAAWQLPIGERTHLQLSTSAKAGIRRQSGLGWYDARSPLPDNYRNMPSYADDRASEEVWRSGDPRYTQIDWDELIAQNRLRGGEAAYTLEDRVEEPLQIALRAAFRTKTERAELDYGLSVAWDRSRYYKRMRDLLGADYLTDIDQYLIDDDRYSNQLENNLRNPSRRIGEGDRFGYDYALESRHIGGWLRGAWQSERWWLEGMFAVGEEQIERRGYYEKELFAGNQSYGRSRSIRMTTYTLKGVASYALASDQLLELTLAAGSRTPEAGQLFVQPLYNNRTVEDPAPERYYGARLRYRRTGTTLSYELSALFSMTTDGLETRRYYDDLAGVYSDLSVQGIARRAFSVEAAASWRASYRWRFTAACSWGDYRYVRDPRVTILSDVDNSVVDADAVSRMGDCRMGSVPSLAASLSARYWAGRGWSVTLTGGLATGRYVDPAALRRTDRVADQAGTTPESFAAFTEQARLADSYSVDLALFKYITFDNESQLQLSLRVNNLLNAENVSYGYESLRSQWQGTGDHAVRMPQASRYLYDTPRSVVVSVGYCF